jgi:hypothetical protein
VTRTGGAERGQMRVPRDSEKEGERPPGERWQTGRRTRALEVAGS